MALQWAVFGDSAAHVISWLDAQHLSRMESAGKGVDREIIRRCWEALSSMERRNLEWRPWLLQILPEDTPGKDTLKELVELRQYLNTIPESWSPQIRSLSPSSLHLSPCQLNADAISGVVPPWASVPLALGITLGDYCRRPCIFVQLC